MKIFNMWCGKCYPKAELKTFHQLSEEQELKAEEPLPPVVHAAAANKPDTPDFHFRFGHSMSSCVHA